MSEGLALHLLRHGEPEGAGRLLGHGDAALLAGGIALCQRLTAGLRVAAVLASDLARARLAGEAIAGDLSLACRIDPRWRELDFGAWDGADPAGLPDGVLARFHADPNANPPAGGERWSALCARVGAALAEVRTPSLVVTHAGAIRAALSLLLGLDYPQSWAFHLPYAALVSLRVWPGEAPRAQVTGLRA